MNRTSAFMMFWVRADTHIAGLDSWQYRRVRALCEKFFDKGRAYEQSKNMLPSANNQQCDEVKNAGCED